MCALCCQDLLERRSDSVITDKNNMDASVTPTRTPMMGLRVLQEFPATEVSSGENQGARTPARPPKRFSFVIRSPECPVCGHAASNVSLHSLNDWRLCLAGSHQEPRSKSNCKQSFNILWCHRSCANSGLQIRQMYRRKRDSKLATYKNPLYSLPEKHETSPRPSS